MRAQLDHLARLMTERPEQIEIRVMPFTAGAHPALGGPFQILSFPSPRLPDLVWQEVLTSSDIIDQSNRVADYVVTFAEARERALSSDGVAGSDPADRQGDDVTLLDTTPDQGWFKSSRSSNNAALRRGPVRW